VRVIIISGIPGAGKTPVALMLAARFERAALTMDRFAARAGVGKAALYRRWRSKEQMLAELVETLGGDGQTPAPDLGSLRADLIAYLDSGDTDIELALGLITAPVIVRVFIMGESLDGDYSERLIDAVLRTLQAGRTQGA
jgi:AcrR family transcriptional regulator